MAPCTSSSSMASLDGDEGVGGVAGDGRGAAGPAEPLGDAGAGPGGQHPLGDDRARQEVGLQELAQAGADLVLAVGDDGGVRDRDAERVAEQRRDREPVGEPADHRRLGRGPHVADPRRRRPPRPSGRRRTPPS